MIAPPTLATTRDQGALRPGCLFGSRIVPVSGRWRAQSSAPLDPLRLAESAITLHAIVEANHDLSLGPSRVTRSEPGRRYGMPPTHAESVVTDASAMSSDVRERSGMRMTTSEMETSPAG